MEADVHHGCEDEVGPRSPRAVVLAGLAPAALVAASLVLSGATSTRSARPASLAGPAAAQPSALHDTSGLPRGWGDVGPAGTCVVAARVREQDGEPAVGASLRLTRVSGAGVVEVWHARADRGGAHRFIGLPAGDYHLTARVDGHAPGAAPAFTCDGDEARAHVELGLRAASHVVTGRVRSADGGLAPGAEVVLSQEDDARDVLAGPARIPVAPDGTFAIPLAPGRYAVRVLAPHHAPRVDTLRVTSEGAATRVRYTLIPAPRVEGRVVDAEGRPVPQALVALAGLLDPRQRPPATRAGDDGTFSLPVMLGQPAELTARGRAGLGRASVGAVTTRFGVAGVTIVVAPGRTVRGAVARDDGTPWAWGAVRYRVRELGLGGVERLDGHGAFAIDGMPPDAAVEVWAEGNATGAWGAQVAVPGSDVLAVVYTPPAY